MAKKQKQTEGIVKPSVQVSGQKHALEKLFDGDAVPELKSIGYTKLGGANSWVSYVITTKGREVVSIEIDEPNMRTLAEEASKINFVTVFVDQEMA